MENNKKSTVNVIDGDMTANTTTDKAETEKINKAPIVVANVSENHHLVLEREAIREKTGKLMKAKDGRQLFSYLAKGKVRERDIKVDFIPKDIGGYEPLDILFESGTPVELIISEEKQSDMSGNVITRTIYTAQTFCDDNVFSCEIKPQRNSDKSLLGMLLNAIK